MANTKAESKKSSAANRPLNDAPDNHTSSLNEIQQTAPGESIPDAQRPDASPLHSPSPMPMMEKNLAASHPHEIRPPLTEERIRELAYFKWQTAGSPPGDGVNFWVEAENELAQVEQKED